MSRRYADVDYERRDNHHRGPRTESDYPEYEYDRSYPSRQQPDFLREGYGQTNSGPLVVRQRDYDDHRSAREPSHRGGDIERDEIIIRREEIDGYDKQPHEPRRRPAPSTRGGDIERDEVIIRREEVEGYEPHYHEPRRRERRPPPPSTRGGDIERDEIIIRREEIDRHDDYPQQHRPRRERAPPPSARGGDIERDEIIIRREEIDDHESEPRRPRRERAPPPSTRGGDIERDEIIIRREEIDNHEPEPRKPRRERAPPPSTRGGDVERDEIIIRREEIEGHDDHSHERRPYREARPPRGADVERDEIIIRREELENYKRPSPEPRRREPRERSHEHDHEREEIIIRREEIEGKGRPAPRSVHPQEPYYDDYPSRPRERSHPPPGNLIARDREEIIVRRRDESRQPPPQPEIEREEIIIRRTEKDKPPSSSSSSSRSPSPPPMKPIIRPPIHQEVITHHRHIDHGFKKAKSSSSSSRSPSPKREELEIEIRKTSRGGNVKAQNEDFIYEREARERKAKEQTMRLSRRRSHSDHRQNQYYDAEVAREAEYYHRKNAERAYIGEAYNGATKDWAIVDVPPGTNRVHMDGVGGAEQDVTWQRYNGVRRSKFIADGHEYDSGYGVGDYGDYGDRRVAPRSKKKEMWTEITKDLVVKDAIEMVGLEYEETEYFYYVMEYLRYEDVLRLVDLSEDIKQGRQERILEIQWEREERDRRRALQGSSRYEREVVYESGGRHWHH